MPKGPVAREEILDLAQEVNWSEQVRLSEVGSEQWLTFEQWSVLHHHLDSVTLNPPVLERSGQD